MPELQRSVARWKVSSPAGASCAVSKSSPRPLRAALRCGLLVGTHGGKRAASKQRRRPLVVCCVGIKTSPVARGHRSCQGAGRGGRTKPSSWPNGQSPKTDPRARQEGSRERRCSSAPAAPAAPAAQAATASPMRGHACPSGVKGAWPDPVNFALITLPLTLTMEASMEATEALPDALLPRVAPAMPCPVPPGPAGAHNVGWACDTSEGIIQHTRRLA